MHDSSELSVWEEHLFWLGILQDHAIFVRDWLPTTQTSYVQAAAHYVDAFEQHLQQLGQLDSSLSFQDEQMIRLARSIWSTAYGYFQFEGTIQRLRIENVLTINLSPTYFNGTLNENEEYLRLLRAYVQGAAPEPLPLWSLLDLWLEDQLGHAALLRNISDPIELGIIKQAERYISIFQAFIVQNHHIRGYLRFAAPGMPRQRLLAVEVGRAALEMNAFIVEVIGQYKESEYLSRTTLRFLQHHLPETCYFVRKLSAYAPELAQTAATCSVQRPPV
ncbi:DUF2935 domain-containing protein [Paenibacillus sp. YYML68]|uniref:DUF2935 domain-containing protein n=1 Tax=Paenibacillus sp. YYML68 TaxID=2909250 RepID=UPI002491E641|nr:DUF2935 domain-containing protein [Paenibacillus sp. YYML68]